MMPLCTGAVGIHSPGPSEIGFVSPRGLAQNSRHNPFAEQHLALYGPAGDWLCLTPATKVERVESEPRFGANIGDYSVRWRLLSGASCFARLSPRSSLSPCEQRSKTRPCGGRRSSPDLWQLVRMSVSPVIEEPFKLPDGCRAVIPAQAGMQTRRGSSGPLPIRLRSGRALHRGDRGASALILSEAPAVAWYLLSIRLSVRSSHSIQAPPFCVK